MATQLVIRDGDPHWWNSPDIWVVPGIDPNGAPGQPVAGQPAFVWGRVRNAGEQAISGAMVNFYWSNPAAGVLRSNSTPIGSSFVDLAPWESKEVLCVIPWLPVIVNGGHECLVAEVIHSADPMPVPLPDAFNPPAYRQVAQKNLTVLAIKKSARVISIQLAASPRIARTVTVTVEQGGELDKENLVHAGLKGFVPARVKGVKAGLSVEPGCGETDMQEKLRVELKPGATRAVYLHIGPVDSLTPGTYHLVHVVSRQDKKTDGGVSFILTSAKEG